VRARAIRLMLDHRDEHPSRWVAIASISTKTVLQKLTRPATRLIA
jgi:hypothetical protein